ncbi:MAG: cyclic nucleotide-binding domain-containing protein [Bacteroidales bacterium]|jgi:CRP-like cAMP-binding protein|nr:cyclic nucleotide-binding domain-containing protein [Bacteroidales bacterium]
MNEKPLEIENRIKLLKQIPVFSMLEEQGLRALASLLEERQTRAQEPLFKKGDPGESMYILAEGEVRVHDGNHVIARLQAGEVFGEFALLDTESRSASVTTEKESRVLILDREALMPFLREFPEILLSMLQLQIKRMRDMNELEDKLSKSYLKISRQKQEIETQHEAIKDQKAQLEIQNKDLEELNAQKKQLLSIIIHGLKNPMTSVQTMAGLLEEGKQAGTDESEYLEILKRSLARMNLVINDLIQTNQDDASRLRRKTPVKISSAIEEVIEMHSAEITAKGLDFCMAESGLTIELQESYFAQLLDKLIEWVVDHSEPKTKLFVQIKQQESVLVIFKFQCKDVLLDKKSNTIVPASLFEVAPEQLRLFSFIHDLKVLSGLSLQLNHLGKSDCELQINLNLPAEQSNRL